MFTQVSNILSFGRKKVIGPKCAFPPSYSISFPVFLNRPSFQGNSQWILGCIPPSLRVAGRCSSGCSEGLWSKYPNALLELMSKKYSITANLKVEKSFSWQRQQFTHLQSFAMHKALSQSFLIDSSINPQRPAEQTLLFSPFTGRCMSKGWSRDLNSDHQAQGSFYDTWNTQLI